MSIYVLLKIPHHIKFPYGYISFKVDVTRKLLLHYVENGINGTIMFNRSERIPIKLQRLIIPTSGYNV